MKIAVAGALSVDICPTFTTEGAENFGDLITAGRITHIEGNEIHPGGPVANTGLALKIFGIHPVMCARIGRDDMGKMLYEILSKKMRPFSVDTISIDEKDATKNTVVNKAQVPTPYIILGTGIKPAIVRTPVSAKCIAPTLAGALHIRAPNASETFSLDF